MGYSFSCQELRTRRIQEELEERLTNQAQSSRREGPALALLFGFGIRNL